MIRVTLDLTRDQIVSANDRMHWAPKAARTKAIRQRARLTAEGRPINGPARRSITVTYGDRARRRDAENLAPVAKAATDGVVDAALLVDDDTNHITATSWQVGEPHGRRGVTVVVIEIEEIPA